MKGDGENIGRRAGSNPAIPNNPLGSKRIKGPGKALGTKSVRGPGKSAGTKSVRGK